MPNRITPKFSPESPPPPKGGGESKITAATQKALCGTQFNALCSSSWSHTVVQQSDSKESVVARKILTPQEQKNCLEELFTQIETVTEIESSGSIDLELIDQLLTIESFSQNSLTQLNSKIEECDHTLPNETTQKLATLLLHIYTHLDNTQPFSREELVEIGTLTTPFIPYFESGRLFSDFISLLIITPKDRRAELIETATPYLRHTDQREIIEGIANILYQAKEDLSFEERQAIVRDAAICFDQCTEKPDDVPSYFPNILNCVNKLSKDRREIVKAISSSFSGESAGAKIFYVLSAIEPTTSLAQVKAMLSIYKGIKKTDDENDSLEILKNFFVSMVKLPEKDVGPIVDTSIKFLEIYGGCIQYSQGKLSDLATFITKVGQLPSEKRQFFAQEGGDNKHRIAASALAEKKSLKDLIHLSESVVLIPEEQVKDIVQAADQMRPIDGSPSIDRSSNFVQASLTLPAETRVSTVKTLIPFIKNPMQWDREGLEKLFALFTDLSQEETAAFIKPFKQVNTPWSLNKLTEVLTKNKELPADERGVVLSSALPYLDTVPFGLDSFMAVLTALKEIPQSNRAETINNLEPYKKTAEENHRPIQGELYAGLLTLVNKNRHVVSLLEMAAPQTEANLREIYDFFKEFKTEKIDVFHRLAKKLEPQFENERLELWGALYFSAGTLEHLTTLASNPDITQETIFTHFQNFLETSANQECVEELARIVTSVSDDDVLLWGLNFDHPLVQTAIATLAVAEQDGITNPYTIYKKHQERDLINFRPNPSVVAGEMVALDPAAFQKTSEQYNLTTSDLPEGVTETTWKDLCAPLLEHPKSEEEIVTLTGCSWDAIELSIKSPLMHSLLKSAPDQPLSILQAQFASVLWFLKEEGNEETIYKVIAGIQHCRGGKEEGIALTYNQLPPKYKIKKQVAQSGSPQENAAFEYLASFAQKYLLDQFSGTNALMKELIGKDNEISQAVHQALYLKNLIGKSVGLAHEIRFDPHTGVVYDSLLTKTPQEALEVFYKYVTPEAFAEALCQAAPPYETLSPIVSDPQSSWELEEEDDYSYRLTLAGARDLLLKAGYLSPSQ
ncbi:MAG: hypothetical protein S4CHLAM45_02720 [Chlamydiales bacterium]|nr:hypothetical protein [Chlamydiales bacterium]MCH9619130.1 hypothetical protein [Chlamydiales bacterium]MCH9622392.1 hypothetical protein [Chlamydiales bacterium]